MQQPQRDEDELTQQLSAWEAEGNHQLAMGNNTVKTRAGGLSYDASAVGSALSVSLHACHSATSLDDSSDSGDSDDVYTAINNNVDPRASNSGWPQKHSRYEEAATAPAQDVSNAMKVAREDQGSGTSPPAVNYVFPSADGEDGPADDKNPMPTAVDDSVKGEAISGRRDALNQGVRRLLNRAYNTHSAMRRGVRRVREIVGTAYRHAIYNNAVAPQDREVCVPLLEDDADAGQEDCGTRSLDEFVKADQSLFR